MKAGTIVEVIDNPRWRRNKPFLQFKKGEKVQYYLVYVGMGRYFGVELTPDGRKKSYQYNFWSDEIMGVGHKEVDLASYL